MKIGIIVSEFNSKYTNSLLKGCLNRLKEHQIDQEDIFQVFVPGSFEIPIMAKIILSKKEIDILIVIGCVIRGQTYHFEAIVEGVVQGIQKVSIEKGKPIIFGVLTTNTRQQAIDRSGDNKNNKGIEFADSAIKLIEEIKKIED